MGASVLSVNNNFCTNQQDIINEESNETIQAQINNQNNSKKSTDVYVDDQDLNLYNILQNRSMIKQDKILSLIQLDHDLVQYKTQSNNKTVKVFSIDKAILYFGNDDSRDQSSTKTKCQSHTNTSTKLNQIQSELTIDEKTFSHQKEVQLDYESQNFMQARKNKKLQSCMIKYGHQIWLEFD